LLSAKGIELKKSFAYGAHAASDQKIPVFLLADNRHTDTHRGVANFLYAYGSVYLYILYRGAKIRKCTGKIFFLRDHRKGLFQTLVDR